MEQRRKDPPTAANRRRPLWRPMSTQNAATGGDNSAKAVVAEQISQTVQSTSNLLHLMQHSSPAQAKLVKLPKNLLAKVSTVKNTEQVLEQLPRVISSLDAHMENGLQNVPQLKTVVQLLANMESSQLSSLSRTHVLEKEHEPGNQSQGTD